MLWGLCSHLGLYLQPDGGNCGLCSPAHGRSVGGETPELILLQLQESRQCFHHDTTAQKPALGVLPSTYVRQEGAEGQRDQYWILGEVLVLQLFPWAQFCALHANCTTQSASMGHRPEHTDSSVPSLRRWVQKPRPP